MGKTFSCTFGNCNCVFARRSDLKKHIFRHTKSKLHKCTLCDFETIYAKNHRNHMNTHSKKRPFVCPDTIQVPDDSGSSSQPTFSEIPCTYQSNCDSALIKHRVRKHGYVTGCTRSRPLARRDMAESSGAATASSNGTVPPNEIVSSSSNQASHPAPAHPSVNFVLPPVGQSFDSNHRSARIARDSRYAQAWSIACELFASMTHARSSASQHANGGTAALPSCELPNDPASVSPHNFNVSAHASSAPPHNAAFSTWSPAGTFDLTHSASVSSSTGYGFTSPGSYVASALPPAELLYPAPYLATSYGEGWNNHAFAQDLTNGTSAVAVQYDHVDHGTTVPFPVLSNTPATESESLHESDSGSSYVASNDSTYTPPDVAIASAPEADYSTDSVHLANDDSLIPASSPAPPFDYDERSELDDLFGDAPTDMAHPVEPIEPSPSVQNDPAEDTVAPPTPSSEPVVAPVPPETDCDVDIDAASESSESDIDIGPGLLDFETALHEDDIFFRGTGREGCLCPEMMIDAGVEGWDRSLLDQL